MERSEDVLIFFGWNGVLYADAVRKKLQQKMEIEARIETKLERLKAELEELNEEKKRALGREKDE